MSGITVSYSGIHQAFQLALAAEELGSLNEFYTSFFDAPRKWGHLASGFFGSDSLANRRCPGIPSAKVREYPWPWAMSLLKARLAGSHGLEWQTINPRFDRWVARHLKHGCGDLFVGGETCALQSLTAARRAGMKTLLDCPGVDAGFLDELAVEAAREFGLPRPECSDDALMRERKDQELQLADTILVCSQFQVRTMRRRNIPPERLVVAPLWVDPQFWHPNPTPNGSPSSPLRILFAGRISLRKGVPYLLKAASLCSRKIKLTLIGALDPALKPFLAQFQSSLDLQILQPRTKAGLRALYWTQDLLVLPSLGDSFGFVALEAMGCGLPVIVTENCGVPVPDPAWRVPVMNSEDLARRLDYYSFDRGALKRDSALAVQFASQFTPERYRNQTKSVFRRLLANSPELASVSSPHS